MTDPIPRPLGHAEPDDPPLASTLGELRKVVQIADGLDAPDESTIYVTLATNGATRHGSRLRTITVVAPEATP